MTEKEIQELRLRAYKLDVDPDQAEELARYEEIGLEKAHGVLDIVEEFVEQQSLGKPVSNDRPGAYFCKEADKLRKAVKRQTASEKITEQHASHRAEYEKSYEAGYKPDRKTIFGQIVTQLKNGEISKKDYDEAIKWLEFMEEGKAA